jgi:hypothetical protein
MDVSRRRFGSLVEWLLAAGFFAAGIVSLSIAADQFRDVDAIVPVIANEAPAPTPVLGIPAGVVSLPILQLGAGREVRLGQTLDDVVARLGTAAQLVSESAGDTDGRPHLIRSYLENRLQFILVFDAERTTAARLSAIYMP